MLLVAIFVLRSCSCTTKVIVYVFMYTSVTFLVVGDVHDCSNSTANFTS